MKKTLDVIKDFVHEVIRYNVNMDNGGNRGEYLITLTELNQELEVLYTPDDNGIFPKVTEENLNSLREKYMSAYRATEQLHLEQNGFAEIKESFMNHLGMDFKALSGSFDMTGKSLPEIFTHNRGYEVDVTGQDISVSGANMNSRMPVSFTDMTEKKITGFFTEGGKLSMQDELDGIFKKVYKEHPEYERAVKMLLNNKEFEDTFSDVAMCEAQFRRFVATEDANHFFDEMLWDSFPKNAPPKEEKNFEKYINSLTKNDSFALCMMELAESYAHIKNKYRVFEAAGIHNTANLEQRNAAMSSVADAMGVSDLLARSVKMRLINNGEEKEGVFMEFASGSDAFHLKEDDPLNRIDKEGLNNPKVIKDLANLQIIDYICGNVDRHIGNMFYQIEEVDGKPKLVGIQGIDNDCSFGALEPAAESEVLQFVGSDDLMVINESMANKVEAMTQDSLKMLLKDHGLSSKEVEAAWVRVQKIQDSIEEGKRYFAEHPEEKTHPGKLRVVKDNEWETFNLDDLTYKISEKGNKIKCKNYFLKIATLPEALISVKHANDVNQKYKEERERRFPQLKKEEKPFKIAEGNRLDEFNRAGIAHHRSLLTKHGNKMLDVNKRVFVSSKEFQDIMESFRAVSKKMALLNEDVNLNQLTDLRQSYNDLMEKTSRYLTKKEAEQANLQKKGKEPSKTMKKRMQFAYGLKQFLDERLYGIDVEMEEFNQQKEAIAKKISENKKNIELKNAKTEEKKREIEAKYFGRGHEIFEQKILDKTSFNAFTNMKTKAELTLLSSSPVKEIKALFFNEKELKNEANMSENQGKKQNGERKKTNFEALMGQEGLKSIKKTTAVQTNSKTKSRKLEM